MFYFIVWSGYMAIVIITVLPFYIALDWILSSVRCSPNDVEVLQDDMGVGEGKKGDGPMVGDYEMPTRPLRAHQNSASPSDESRTASEAFTEKEEDGVEI